VAQCGFAARFKTEGGLAKNIGRDGLNHGIGPFVLGADCGPGAGGSTGRARTAVRDPEHFASSCALQIIKIVHSLNSNWAVLQ